jgi:hypothetical protein
MKTFMTGSKSTQMYPTQQTQDNGRPKQASPSMPTHDDIARRAYEIYLKNGRRQGKSEQNWLQAEHELRNKKIESAMQR